MSEWYKQAFDDLYLEIYSHRDEKEAEKFVSSLGRVVAIEGLVLLDVCCGDGRYLRAFENAGAIGFGLDLSEVLLERFKANRADELYRVVRGDMRDFPFRSESFDICINMFTSLGYFGTTEEELRVIRETWRALRPGGFFVLDHVNPTWIENTLEPRSLRKKGEVLVEERRKMIDGGKAVEKTISIRSVKAPDVPIREYREKVALFRKDELQQMLEQAGYAVVKLFGDYDGSPFQKETSPRLIVLARKP
ncbi:MAG: hypothetical protein AMJ46_05830 [Latescibacteria bacterium DG_63]|nr:MAG: hypothetical protein AMJ46_05830 [Latescibacteria bacterium DG_63]